MNSEKQKTSFTSLDKIAAWSVHSLTASGIFFGFLSIVALSEQDFRMGMFWLLICYIIDGIDGSFARKFKVWEVLPHFSGKTVDAVIDFTTYAVIPTYFLYQAQLVPEALMWPTVAVMLLVSTFYYGKSGMITEDLHFQGFPVLWNFVIFYMFFVFSFQPWVNFLIIMLLGILHFVPFKFVYPSRTEKLFIVNIAVTVILLADIALLVFYYPEKPSILYWVGAASLAYYIASSIISSLPNRQIKN